MSNRGRAATLVLAVASVVGVGCTPDTTPPPLPAVERVDVDGSGAAANGPCCYVDGYATQSGDGRRVLFSSLATNLVAGDTNAGQPQTLAGLDWFVRDRVSGVTTRVSVLPGGTQLANYLGEFPRVTAAGMSSDGRFVVFGVQNFGGAPDALYRFDLNTGQSTLVRQFAPGDPTPRGSALEVSTAGNIVAFAAGNVGGRAIVLDVVAGTLTDVAPADHSQPRLSDDGRYLASDDRVVDRLTSASTPLVPGGAEGEDAVVAMSGNGEHILFRSNRAGLAPGDTNAADDLFVKNRLSGVIRLATTGGGADGIEPSVGWTAQRVPFGATTLDVRYMLASISDDGNTVAFSTDQDDVPGADSDPGWDTFVRNLSTGATRVITTDSDSHARFAVRGGDFLSGDGSRVVFAAVRNGVGGLWSSPAA